MTTKKDRNDDLLNRLDQLERLAAHGTDQAKKIEADPSEGAAKGIRQTLQGLRAVGAFVQYAASMGRYFWQTIGRPVWNVLDPVLGRAGRFYRDRVWSRAYSEDEGGEKKFSPKRAGIVLTATFAAAALAVPAAHTTARFGAEAFALAATTRHETVYLHTVTPPDENGIVYVQGCERSDSCSADEAVTYEVEASLAGHLWTLFNEGSLYVPSRLTSAVSPDSSNQCGVTIFKAKNEKLWKNLGVYPELLDISCVRAPIPGGP